MNKIRMSPENLIGVLLFFFIVLGSFLKLVQGVDYVDDLMVVRSVQLVGLAVILYVIWALLSFESYNNG